MSAAPPVIKKKPGRPKKRIDTSTDFIRGVVSAPENPLNSLELVYRDPQLFKGIVSLLRQYSINEVELSFDHTKIHINAIDRLKKTRVYANIDGSMMNSYYCKEPTKVCVRCETFDSVLSTVLRSHGKITFCLLDGSSRSALTCFMRDSEHAANHIYAIDILYKPSESLNGSVDEDAGYPLKFKFDSKYLKLLCQNVSKFTDHMTIQKVGSQPMQISYNQPHLMNGVVVYDNANIIGLKSTLTPEDILSVTVSIAIIEPISKIPIGDDVSVAVDHTMPISLTSNVHDDDGRLVAVVKVFNDLRTV